MSRQNNSANWLTIVAIAVIAVIGLASSAHAQLRPWDSNNEVLVDLSVLGDSGIGPSPASGFVALPGLTGDLLDPPSRMPRSRLLVKRPPVAGAFADRDLPKVTLKRPGKSRAKTSKRRRVAKSRAKPRAKPRSRAPKVAALKAPPTKPSIKTTKPATKLAPAPKAAPKPPVKITKAKPAPMPKAAPPPPNVKVPAPVAKPKMAPKAPQTASRPSPTSPASGAYLTFKPGDPKLSGDSRKALDELAEKLNAQPKSRMQLLAYAGEANLSASKARRLSLSRALAVRSYLIKKGVRSTRIDVRALGKKVPSGPPNRVDLKVVGQ